MQPASMAPPSTFRHRVRRNRARVVVYDDFDAMYFVYSINLNGLFFSGRRRTDDDAPATSGLHVFADPVARFPCYMRREGMAFVVTSSANIVAASAMRRTFVYHSKSRTLDDAAPYLVTNKCGPIAHAVAGHMLAMSGVRCVPDGPNFEALDLTSSCTAAWRALPDPPDPPPPAPPSFGSRVKASFVADGRVWVSVSGLGTYSLDIARREWRREGSWEVPLEGRPVYVPDLGKKKMLFGFNSEHRNLCACDMEARPPVIVREWRRVRPTLRESRGCYTEDSHSDRADLAYLGGGRFCVSRHIVVDRDGFHGVVMRRGVALTAVTVTSGGGGGLQLRKHKSRCYILPQDESYGYVL